MSGTDVSQGIQKWTELSQISVLSAIQMLLVFSSAQTLGLRCGMPGCRALKVYKWVQSFSHQVVSAYLRINWNVGRKMVPVISDFYTSKALTDRSHRSSSEPCCWEPWDWAWSCGKSLAQQSRDRSFRTSQVEWLQKSYLTAQGLNLLIKEMSSWTWPEITILTIDRFHLVGSVLYNCWIQSFIHSVLSEHVLCAALF